MEKYIDMKSPFDRRSSQGGKHHGRENFSSKKNFTSKNIYKLFDMVRYIVNKHGDVFPTKLNKLMFYADFTIIVRRTFNKRSSVSDSEKESIDYVVEKLRSFTVSQIIKIQS